MNILLGVTGSVAAIKLPKLVSGLRELGEVKTVVTESAMKFLRQIRDYGMVGSQMRDYGVVGNEFWGCHNGDKIPVITDSQEWGVWSKIGDPVLHIDLTNWADVFVIAPLTANTLAKMAHGLSDNLLTCIVTAWPAKKPPILIAPAMNTDMWENIHTKNNIAKLTNRVGMKWLRPTAHLIYPTTKKLACGTTGVGAMAEISEIVIQTRDMIGARIG